NWRDADGSEMMPGTWGRQEPRVLMLTIEPARERADEGQETLLILFNASNDAHPFRIPKIGKRRSTHWQVVLDTSEASGRSEVLLAGGKDAAIPGCSILMAV